MSINNLEGSVNLGFVQILGYQSDIFGSIKSSLSQTSLIFIVGPASIEINCYWVQTEFFNDIHKPLIATMNS